MEKDLSTEGTAGMKVGLVISTIGRVPQLTQLFDSLESSTLRPHRVVVSDQDLSRDTEACCNGYLDRLPIVRVKSSGGLSSGRNTALPLVADCDLVGFPDDDVWYGPAAIERAAHAASVWGADLVSGALLSEAGKGSRRSWPSNRAFITSANVWRLTMEATVFIRGERLHTLRFNESLGVGCSTPWQSGEGTELILRGLAEGWSAIYDPTIKVFEVEPLDVPHRIYRAYGRGTGRVLATQQGRRIPRALAGAAGRTISSSLRLDYQRTSRDAAALLGILEGLTGRTLP